jgi:hypothetical protein
MAAATYDIKALNAAHLQPVNAHNFQHVVDVDAALVDGGAGFGAGESAEFYTIPAGSLVEAVDAYILTPAGATCTVDIGDETNPDGFLDGGDCEGAAGTRIALAGTEADRALAAEGRWFAAATGLRVTFPAANAVAKLRIVIRGHTVDLA